MHKIALLINPRISTAKDVAAKVAELASSRGTEVWTGTLTEAEQDQERISGANVVFTFGGDGTIIRASKTCAPLGIPIVGVAMGQLGFMAELQVSEIEAGLSEIFAERYCIEERIMLHSSLWRDGLKLAEGEALNDVAVLRGAIPRVIEVTVHIDGTRLTKWVADGAIVATPTGSTAYSLASGGPVAHPEVRALILTPVAAHLNNLHSLVVPETSVIRLTLSGMERAVLSVDGQINTALIDGDYAMVRMSKYICRLVRLQGTEFFYHRLVDRLQRKD